MKRLPSSLKNWINTDRSDFIRTLLLSEGFGFCLCLSFIWGYRLDRYGSVSGWLVPSLILSLVLGDVLSDVLMCLWAVLRDRESARICESDSGINDMNPETRPRTISVRLWVISGVLILIAWVPVWLAYYPAVFAYDAETQLGQVISQIYSTHHPLMHTLIMGGCMKLMWDVGGINAGMAMYAALQMILMAGVCGWMIAEAHRLGTRRWLLWVYGCFCALFPVHAILAISTTKDSVFAGLMAVFVLLVRRCLADEGGLIRLVVATALMILFRNNAVYALVFMMIILAAVCITGRRSGRKPVKGLLIAILIGCIAGCLINTGLKAVLHAESGSPREALSIPIQQMARVYVRHGEELPAGIADDLAVLLAGTSEDLTVRYNEHLADPVKRQIYMKEPARFVKTWVRLGLRYPGDYLDAWLYTTEGAWYIRDTSVNRIYGEGSAGGFGYLSTDIRSMPAGFEVIPRSFIPGLRSGLERLVSDNVFEKIPVIRLVFSPALYVWILAGYGYVRRVRRDYVSTAVLLYPLAVYLTILMGPAVLIRYMYPYMLLVLLPMLPAHAAAYRMGDT